MSEDMEFLPRDEVLSLEESARIVRIFASLGVTKVRITGGEPLVRKNIGWLFHKISNIPTLKEIVITTNGSQLSQHAEMLKKSYVKRINISLDTLDAAKCVTCDATGATHPSTRPRNHLGSSFAA
jgi:cyclic pyranopterin phosphate synthase